MFTTRFADKWRRQDRRQDSRDLLRIRIDDGNPLNPERESSCTGEQRFTAKLGRAFQDLNPCVVAAVLRSYSMSDAHLEMLQDCPRTPVDVCYHEAAIFDNPFNQTVTVKVLGR